MQSAPFFATENCAIVPFVIYSIWKLQVVAAAAAKAKWDAMGQQQKKEGRMGLVDRKIWCFYESKRPKTDESLARFSVNSGGWECKKKKKIISPLMNNSVAVCFPLNSPNCNQIILDNWTGTKRN